MNTRTMCMMVVTGVVLLAMGRSDVQAARSVAHTNATGLYVAAHRAPDHFTVVCPKGRPIAIRRASADPAKPADQGAVQESRRGRGGDRAWIEFTGRTKGWGCLYTVDGVYTGAGAITSIGEQEEWTTTFEDDQDGPKLHLAVDTDQAYSHYIPMGNMGGHLLVAIIGAQENTTYTVTLSDKSNEFGLPGRVGIVGSSTVQLTADSPWARVRLEGNEAGDVRLMGECDDENVEAEFADGIVIGAARAYFIPHSPLYTWLQAKTTSHFPMMSAGPKPVHLDDPEKWGWRCSDPYFVQVKPRDEAAYYWGTSPHKPGDPDASRDIHGEVRGFNGVNQNFHDNPMYIGYWLTRWRPQVKPVLEHGPAPGAELTSGIFYEYSNTGTEPFPVTLTKAVLASFDFQLEGTREYVIEDMHKHEAGGTFEVSVGKWGIVDAKAGGHYTYGEHHKEAAKDVSRIMEGVTNTLRIQHEMDIVVPPEHRATVTVYIVQRLASGIFEYYPCDGFGAAQDFHDTDQWDVAVPAGSRIDYSEEFLQSE